MRSRKSTQRVLLDTSFILPTLGISTGKRIQKGLQKLKEINPETFISRFSILEALWVAIRLIKRGTFDASTFSQGLRSLLLGRRYKIVEEDHRIFEAALQLYQMGHPDMIDNILYATSLTRNLNLLTVDDQLRTFIREKRLSDTTIAPEEL